MHLVGWFIWINIYIYIYIYICVYVLISIVSYTFVPCTCLVSLGITILARFEVFAAVWMIILFFWNDAMPMDSPFLTLQRRKAPSWSILQFQEANINVLLSLSPRIPMYKVYIMPGQISRASSLHENEKKMLYQLVSGDVWPFISFGILHSTINPLKPELNPICYLLALLAHHFLHVSRIRVKSLTLRWLMSYIYGAPILDVSRSHTTTQHSR